ncbi:MAG: hypothetical protein WCJ66_19570 [Verrucomicrobiota bacterium]
MFPYLQTMVRKFHAKRRARQRPRRNVLIEPRLLAMKLPLAITVAP